ncbi:MAG: ATP-binding protein [Bacteroidales bacterium]|nr:ATP-binding protein [Bacteroidales bacterium]
MHYLKRISDTILQQRLEAMGAVLIVGPKWCGKTTTAEQHAKSVLRLQNPDEREQYLATAAVKPSMLLMGETPRLIDEWQDAPVLWDAVRTMVDKRMETGQFILTGSNAVDESKIRHSGTGRISRMTMGTMSLWESGESNGKISLTDLFNRPDLDIDGIESPMSVEQLIFAACRGGWPAAINAKTDKNALAVVKDYVASVCESDVSRVDGVRRNPKLANLILRSYARNVSTLAKTSSMLDDVTASENISCSRTTFEDYVAALERLFVIQDVAAWCPAIRSKSAIRSGLKRGFCDPSIAVALLQQTPESMCTQLKTFGFVFEQMCIRDLKAYTNDFFSYVGYYHDRFGLESDMVVHLGDGRYALAECKLGSREINEGAGHLIQLRNLIREHNASEPQAIIREPDLMMVLTGGKMAYRREDGVCVIPLACLKD